jgi:hypothetical protein
MTGNTTEACGRCKRPLANDEPAHVHTEPWGAQLVLCPGCHDREIERENAISRARIGRRRDAAGPQPLAAVLLEGFGIAVAVAGFAAPIFFIVGLLMIIAGVLVTISRRQ